MSKSISILRASNGLYFSAADTHVYQLFENGNEAAALAAILNKIEAEGFSGPAEITITDLGTETPPDAGQYRVVKNGYGFVIYTSSSVFISSDAAHLQKLFDGYLSSAMDTWEQGGEYLFTLPSADPE